VCFSVGTYLGFFELINLGIKEGEQVRYVFFRWDDLHTTFEVEWVSLGGVAIYFLGAIFYQVWALCLCLSDELGFALIPDSASTALSLAGGACFAVGGVCEVAYNQILKKLPTTLVWWASLLNFLGGVLYFISSLPCLSSMSSNASTCIGSLLYATAGVLSLWMWRGEQFGLTLLSQLNAVARENGLQLGHRHHDGAIVVPQKACGALQPKTFSLRGMTFLLVYTLSCVLSGLNCCFGGGYMGTQSRDFSMLFESMLYLVIMHMVLLLHSAGLQRIPKQQPYRVLMLLLRLVALWMMGSSFWNFTIFCRERP